MPMTEYKSNKLHSPSNIMINGVIPAHSVIRSIVVQSLKSGSGTVTLQTKSIDGYGAIRIIYFDYIDGVGYYTGSSAKNYFVSKQNIDVKITGGLEVRVNILFWEVGI